MPEDKAKSTKAEEKKTPLDPLVDLPNARPGQEGVGLDVAETRLSHLGHQEVERILDELEKLSHDVSVAAGSGTWLTVNAAQEIILRDLGYEDEGELEDALKGSLESFIRAMPHLDVRAPTTRQFIYILNILNILSSHLSPTPIPFFFFFFF